MALPRVWCLLWSACVLWRIDKTRLGRQGAAIHLTFFGGLCPATLATHRICQECHVMPRAYIAAGEHAVNCVPSDRASGALPAGCRMDVTNNGCNDWFIGFFLQVCRRW